MALAWVENELMKTVKERLKKVIDELGADGFFEEEILEELYLDLTTAKLYDPQASEPEGGLYVQAEFESQGHQKRRTLKELVNGLIEFCDNGDEDCSSELRQAAAELEDLAKVCREAAERHATSGPRVHEGHWPLK